MTKDDRNKLLMTGFTILRVYEEPVRCIKQMTGEHSWSIVDRYETKAAMNRAIKNINEHEQKMIFE